MSKTSSKPKTIDTGRIAFRTEGEQVVAYWCPKQDSMEGKVWLSSMRRIYSNHDKIRQQFMDMNKQIVAIAILTIEGAVTDPEQWDEKPAPEHERAGRA